jgi:hypothetical protein
MRCGVGKRWADERVTAARATFQDRFSVHWPITKSCATLQDLISPARVWNTGRINGDKGIYQQLIAITKRCGVTQDYRPKGTRLDKQTALIENQRLRCLQTLVKIALKTISA